jgi:hypothetical protein
MTPLTRTAIDKIVAQMEASPANIDFKDLMKVCEFHFGPAAQRHQPLRLRDSVAR